MIEFGKETFLTLTEEAASLPRRRGGKRVNVATLYRWTTHGCRGERLEHIQIGGTRFTSQEALQRFFERVSPAPSTTRGPRKPSRPACPRTHEVRVRTRGLSWNWNGSGSEPGHWPSHQSCEGTMHRPRAPPAWRDNLTTGREFEGRISQPPGPGADRMREQQPRRFARFVPDSRLPALLQSNNRKKNGNAPDDRRRRDAGGVGPGVSHQGPDQGDLGHRGRRLQGASGSSSGRQSGHREGAGGCRRPEDQEAHGALPGRSEWRRAAATDDLGAGDRYPAARTPGTRMLEDLLPAHCCRERARQGAQAENGSGRRATSEELARDLVLLHGVDLFRDRDIRRAVAKAARVTAPDEVVSRQTIGHRVHPGYSLSAVAWQVPC